MLEKQELWKSKINLEVVREALSQADKALRDTHETKKAVDQKASQLFTAYVTILLALFGVAGYYLGRDDVQHAAPFIAAGTTLSIGAALLIYAMRPARYGNPGASAKLWLERGIVDGPPEVLPKVLALMLYDYQEKITASDLANETKIRTLVISMTLGPTSAFVALVGFLIVS